MLGPWRRDGALEAIFASPAYGPKLAPGHTISRASRTATNCGGALLTHTKAVPRRKQPCYGGCAQQHASQGAHACARRPADTRDASRAPERTRALDRVDAGRPGGTSARRRGRSDATPIGTTGVAAAATRHESQASTPTPGDVLRDTRRFTRSDLAAFSKLTGDANAIHAEATPPFDAPIVHGLLLASLFPAIFARAWPGAVYRSQNLKFRRAVPADALVEAAIRVEGVRATPRGALVACATSLTLAEDGDVCVDGPAAVWLPDGVR